MATKIRLARGGSKKRPFYRIVVANSRAPRDGDFIEKIGTYDPILPKDNAQRVTLNSERVSYWLSIGAQPTERVIKFIEDFKIELPANLKAEVEKRKLARVAKAPKKATS